MALGDPYAVPADLELRLDTTDDGTFPALLEAASRAVEGFCGRQFNKTTVATARRFRAVDPARLPVDDFHTTTGLAVAVDGVAWVLADVDPRPWDGVVNGQTGWPYFDLFAVDRYWPNKRRPTVSVTAQWGWVAVPEAIKQATLDVAAVMVAGSGGSSGAVRSMAIDGYSVSYATPTMSATGSVPVPSEMAKAVPYKRRRFGVA